MMNTLRSGAAILDADAARDLVAHARIAVLNMEALWRSRVRHNLCRSPGQRARGATQRLARAGNLVDRADDLGLGGSGRVSQVR